MTDRQLRDEAVTLILAGHETTALVLFYTFYLLAQSPEAERRLATELTDVLGDRAPTAARRAQPAIHRVGGPRSDAAVSAGLGHRPRGPGRL